MVKSTISVAMFNSFLYVYQRVTMEGSEDALAQRLVLLGLGDNLRWWTSWSTSCFLYIGVSWYIHMGVS